MANIQTIIQWFETWTKLKIKLHFGPTAVYFREREIWWASLGANIGFEQAGKNQNYERPVLVVRKFNEHMFWGIPLTSKIKTGKYYFPLTTGSAILSQLRVLSSKRLIRKVGVINSNTDYKLRQQLRNLI